MTVKNKCADKLMEGILRHEQDFTKDTWVLEYNSHKVMVEKMVNGRIVQVQEQKDISPREYVEFLRKPRHWGQAEDLFLVARAYGVNVVLLNMEGEAHGLFPYAKPNEPNVHMVSPPMPLSYKFLSLLGNQA